MSRCAFQRSPQRPAIAHGRRRHDGYSEHMGRYRPWARRYFCGGRSEHGILAVLWARSVRTASVSLLQVLAKYRRDGFSTKPNVELRHRPGGGSVGNVRGVHGLLEHRKQRGIDVCRRVRRVEEIRRGAGLQRGRNAGDVAVGVAVLVIENRAGIRDRLIRNVEDRDGDAAILDVGAVIGCRDAVRRDDRRRILIGDRRRSKTSFANPSSLPIAFDNPGSRR